MYHQPDEINQFSVEHGHKRPSAQATRDLLSLMCDMLPDTSIRRQAMLQIRQPPYRPNKQRGK